MRALYRQQINFRNNSKFLVFSNNYNIGQFKNWYVVYVCLITNVLQVSSKHLQLYGHTERGIQSVE